MGKLENCFYHFYLDNRQEPFLVAVKSVGTCGMNWNFETSSTIFNWKISWNFQNELEL